MCGEALTYWNKTRRVIDGRIRHIASELLWWTNSFWYCPQFVHLDLPCYLMAPQFITLRVYPIALGNAIRKDLHTNTWSNADEISHCSKVWRDLCEKTTGFQLTHLRIYLWTHCSHRGRLVCVRWNLYKINIARSPWYRKCRPYK